MTEPDDDTGVPFAVGDVVKVRRDQLAPTGDAAAAIAANFPEVRFPDDGIAIHRGTRGRVVEVANDGTQFVVVFNNIPFRHCFTASALEIVSEAAGTSALREALQSIRELTRQFAGSETIGGDVFHIADRALADEL